MNFIAWCGKCGNSISYDESQIGTVQACASCSEDVHLAPKGPTPKTTPPAPKSVGILNSLYPHRNAYLVDRVRESTHYPVWRLMLLVFPVLAVVNLGLTDMSVWGVGQSFSILVFWRLAVIFTDIADCLVKLAKDR